MISRRAFSGGLGAALLGGSAPAGALPAGPLPALPLSIAVAHESGGPVCDDAWIDAQIAAAERLFSPFGVHLRKAAQRPLAERFSHLETRKDRDALDAERAPGVVNVFLVRALRDVDDPRLYRMGVHWRNGARPRSRYVIVTADAQPTTLAHELGHYNGLAHSPVVNHLMSYQRTSEEVFLQPAQGATILAFARLAFASGELTAPLDPPRP